uniref:SXP/RAL-2 family protein Ani s 5-like cation-binding domain-containing protein n=2 Tax=Parascaris univalens TaxID=6257 RepID=A0A915AA87_PARUN
NYLTVFLFVASVFCHLTTAGAQQVHDGGRFFGGTNDGKSMKQAPQRGFGEGFKSEFFRICSPWHPFGRWWLPDFLKNISNEGMNNFCDIVWNENLTKAETEQQLYQWAQDQGGDIYAQFKNYMDQKKQIRKDVQQKIQELIANVTKFIDDEEKILKDTSLTRPQEKEQLMNLKKEAGWAVVRLAYMIREEAAFIVGEHRREPCPGCGPMFPPFSHHGYGFGPEIPRRGSHFPRDGGEPFRQNEPFGHNGPFEKDESFEHNELPEQHGPHRRYIR